MDQRLGAAAVLAIVCAAVAFFVSPLLGFFLGLAAVLLGIIGFLRSTTPRIRGGMLSLLAIFLGLIAVAVKIVEGALRLLF